MSSLPARVSLTAAIAAGTVASSAVPAFAVEGATALEARALGHHTPAATARVVVPLAPAMIYRVEAGDSVWRIAQRTGTSVSAIVEANNLGANALIRTGQMLTIPSPGTLSSPSVSSAPAVAGTYKVRRGDTLSHIAANHGTTVAALMSANNLRSTVIHPDQILTLGSAAPATQAPAAQTPAPRAPATEPPAGTHTVTAGDTLSHIAKRHGTTVSSLMSANGLSSTTIYPRQILKLSGAAPAPAPTPAPAPASNPAPAPAARSHAVRPGDTLSRIAATYGTTVDALMTANNLRTTTIYAGRSITIPVAGVPTTSAAPATPQLVPSTFLHYKYPEATVNAANVNKATLLASAVPTREEARTLVRTTAVDMGVDPALALAIAMKESGFNHASVSPANAVGLMQVIPGSGAWASDLVGRPLNLLDPRDNVTAGVAIIRQLIRTSSSEDIAIASYYQGAGSVKRNGMFSDTRSYVAGVKAFRAQFSG